MPMMLEPSSPGASSTSSKRTSHFIIEPATIEDVRRLVDIEFHAFENERANHQLSYRDHSKAEHFERSVKLYTTAMMAEEQLAPKTSGRRTDSALESMMPLSRVAFLKVTDTETGEIVSFAKTETKSYMLEELQSPADVGHEGEPQMNRDWFALNERLRRQYIGRAKHCYLSMLATQPCSQHNGAGTILLNKILAEADKQGIAVYLEGTDTARFLYEKHGFEALNDINFDPADYGVHHIGTEHQTIMVRGALGKDGRRWSRNWCDAVAHVNADLQYAM